MERRVREASALRGLFDEQWGYLLNLINNYEIARRSEKDKEEKVTEAVETIIEGIDSRIRGAERYRRRLRSSARGLLNYINELVSRLPAAIAVNQTSIQSDPLVKAFFKDSDEMRNLFCCNNEVRTLIATLPNQEQSEIYALLQLSGRENLFMSGEIESARVEPAGQISYLEFRDHALIAPQTSESGVRKALQRILFECVVDYLREHMQLMRDGKLDEKVYKMLPNECKGTENPENYLDVLEWLLSMPRDLIRLQSNLLEIDNKGIKLPSDTEQPNHLLLLNEVEIGNKPPRLLTIIRCPKEEVMVG